MANDLNRCDFIGRLGRDPEIRYTPNGVAVANFSIAVGEKWKDKNTGEQNEKTEWIKCSSFGKLAEIIAEFLEKGKQVYISGKMQTRQWDDKEGNKRYTTEIVVNQMQMLGGRGDSDSGDYSRPSNQDTSGGGQQQSQSGPESEDVPF